MGRIILGTILILTRGKGREGKGREGKDAEYSDNRSLYYSYKLNRFYRFLGGRGEREGEREWEPYKCFQPGA